MRKTCHVSARPRRLAVGCVSGALLVASIAASGAAAPEGGVVARFGSVEMKAEELRSSLERVEPATRAALGRDPAVLNRLVGTMLVQRLVLQQALAEHWDQRPEVVAQLERTRQTTIVDSYLDSLTEPPANFPSEDEIRSTYESSKAALLVPRQFRLAHIFIATPPNPAPAVHAKARSRAEAVKARLRQPGADFAEVARTESEEKSSAELGGEIGWLTEAQVQPEIRPSVLALAAGAISEPIQLSDGWHILKTLEVKEGYTPTLEAVRAQLVRELRAQRAKTDRQAHLARLLKENALTIDEPALSGLLSGATRPPAERAEEPGPARLLRPKFK